MTYPPCLAYLALDVRALGGVGPFAFAFCDGGGEVNGGERENANLGQAGTRGREVEIKWAGEVMQLLEMTFCELEIWVF